MPEGPEVETVRRTLQPLLLGRRVGSVWLGTQKLRNVLVKQDFAVLVGQEIIHLGRHGKLLWLDFSRGARALIRLGMTGRLTVTSKQSAVEKHTHVRLALKDNDNELRYVDPRRFGEFFITDQSDRSSIDKMGPDPTTTWTAREQTQVAQSIKKSSRSIKEILLDQQVLAGVGNIYASESLFIAKISPFANGCSLSAAQINRLLSSIPQVLQAAIVNGGTSFSDYVDGNGKKGANIDFVQVFMRQGLPCPSCKNTIEKRTQGGRSTYFCCKCQG